MNGYQVSWITAMSDSIKPEKLNKHGGRASSPHRDKLEDVSSGTSLFLVFCLETLPRPLWRLFVCCALFAPLQPIAHDLAVVNDRHAPCNGVKSGSAVIVKRPLLIVSSKSSWLFESRTCELSNGDVRTSSKAFFRPDEVEQITAVVHDRDGRPSTVVLRKFRGGFATFFAPQA